MQASNAPAQVASPLAARLGGFIRYAMHAFGKDFLQAVEEHQLSISQLKALNILAVTERPFSLKELGDALSLSLPAISRSIEALVQRGLVARTEDSEDRRVKRVALTAKGRDVVARIIEIRMAGMQEFLDTLSAGERDALGEAIAPIVARADIAPFCRTES